MRRSSGVQGVQDLEGRDSAVSCGSAHAHLFTEINPQKGGVWDFDSGPWIYIASARPNTCNSLRGCAPGVSPELLQLLELLNS